jgi:GTP cyclohydrolase IA
MDRAAAQTELRALPGGGLSPDPHTSLVRAYQGVLDALGDLGYPVATDENFADTADRAARAMLDLVRPAAEVEREVEELLTRDFPARHPGVVVSRHNRCFGICPHHLLPVSYRVSVAYHPASRVLGISKLSRLIRLLARRPILQEDLTHELAAALHDRIGSRGSAVLVEGEHLCLVARGAEAREAQVTTSAIRGIFETDAATRREFFSLALSPRPAE